VRRSSTSESQVHCAEVRLTSLHLTSPPRALAMARMISADGDGGDGDDDGVVRVSAWALTEPRIVARSRALLT